MRKPRDADGTRKFKRSEWLTKTQVQGYFSRLSALKRRKGTVSQAPEEDDDDDSLIEKERSYLEDQARQNEVLEDVVNEMGLIHPITYDGHDLERVSRDTLWKRNVTTLAHSLKFLTKLKI